MTVKSSLAAGLLLACIATASIASAAQPGKAPPDPTRDPLMTTAGFLSSHPDLRYRLLGLERMHDGKAKEAFEFFKRAAYYADKPAQGMVAEMLWNGQGTETDPALAYAWMDLAAERGYKGFTGLRERYWSKLDERQRARATEEGQAVYATYGDEAAKPRLATVLRRERMRMTGSRLGTIGNLKIYVPGPDGEGIAIDGSKFYDERYWNPDKYLQWHDDIWMEPRIAKVDVGELTQVPPAQPESRIPEVAPIIDAEEPKTEDAMPRMGDKP